MNVNRIIAGNIRSIRTLRGYKQKDLLDRLEPSFKLSVSNLSAIENSADPDKQLREFTADELLAFAQALDVPVSLLFFIGPDTEVEVGRQMLGAGQLYHLLRGANEAKEEFGRLMREQTAFPLFHAFNVAEPEEEQ